MLSTKDMSAGSGKVKPVISVGNQVIKINSITYERFSPYPYKDATLPSGREIQKDQEILKAMVYLSEVLDKRYELDMIEAETIEQFMTECNTLFSNTGFFNACVGGREWENKEGYVNYDLFLPRMSKEGIPLEALNKDNSRLLEFSKKDHVRELQNKSTTTTQSNFEPASTSTGDDFDL